MRSNGSYSLCWARSANLFLILRWGNIDMVIPFSLFVVSAILVFYCPLIDRRVEELDEIKSKGEEDYSTYNNLITGFTGEAFNFSELEGRKDEYISYADQQLAWARQNLRRIHTALILTGFGFVALATSRYSFSLRRSHLQWSLSRLLVTSPLKSGRHPMHIVTIKLSCPAGVQMMTPIRMTTSIQITSHF